MGVFGIITQLGGTKVKPLHRFGLVKDFEFGLTPGWNRLFESNDQCLVGIFPCRDLITRRHFADP